jgi:hypothetical protein
MKHALLVAAAPASAQSDAVDRVITVTAIEHEMRRSQERTPFPNTLEIYPELEAGGGYKLTPPGESGEWAARAYQ